MSVKTEEVVNLELILNILGTEPFQKKHLNNPEPKDHLSGFFLKE